MQNIGDYFLIGDLHTAALVSKDGSIDWMCFPHFDSSSIFARILDTKGGSFSLEHNGYNVTSQYIERTAIVESTFQKGNNRFIIKNFMVPQPRNKCDTHFLVRKITGLSKNAKVKLIFNPRPNYARSDILIKHEDNALTAEIGTHKLFLHLPEKTRVKKTSRGYELEIKIKENQTKEFALEYSEKPRSYYTKQDFESKTKKFWEKWVIKGTFLELCRDELIRSAITLKLMQFYPTGAIIAAPTTSLPEGIGGMRNWDYRYVWVRDATFTVYGLYVLGFKEEAQKFFSFIESIAKECEKCDIEVQLLYTIQGKVPPKEEILHMTGYKNSSPVRIGNEAAGQFQLDIYGSLIDAYYFMAKRGVTLSKDSKEIIINLIEKIAKRWKEKDNGIWEIRNQQSHFTYSKIMAWVGVDRALRLCEKLKIPSQTKEKWMNLEKEIKDWVWKHCYDKKLQSFKQHPDTTYQDATNLLFVLLQFLDKKDPLTRTIIRNTCKELVYKDIFVYRYRHSDNLEGDEGAFILCTFWLISALAIIEDVREAEKLFRLFEKKINESGLISEEIDPDTSEYLGNFPQAFSHIGYIMSAYYLNKYRKKKR